MAAFIAWELMVINVALLISSNPKSLAAFSFNKIPLSSVLYSFGKFLPASGSKPNEGIKS